LIFGKEVAMQSEVAMGRDGFLQKQLLQYNFKI